MLWQLWHRGKLKTYCHYWITWCFFKAMKKFINTRKFDRVRIQCLYICTSDVQFRAISRHFRRIIQQNLENWIWIRDDHRGNNEVNLACCVLCKTVSRGLTSNVLCKSQYYKFSSKVVRIVMVVSFRLPNHHE